MNVPDLATIQARIAGYRPDVRTVGPRSFQAATALILRTPATPRDTTDLLLMHRAERVGDRWSGHISLPGGKRHPEDDDLAATAMRETAEEVGVALPEPIGRLDDQVGQGWRGVVATYVFLVPSELPPLVLDPVEVQAAMWMPVTTLVDPVAAMWYRWGPMPFPALRHQEHVVWGLTHRILDGFVQVIGHGGVPRPGVFSR